MNTCSLTTLVGQIVRKHPPRFQRHIASQTMIPMTRHRKLTGYFSFFLFAPFPMWCPFLSHFLPSFFSDFTTKKVDTHTFVSVYFHFTDASPLARPSSFILRFSQVPGRARSALGGSRPAPGRRGAAAGACRSCCPGTRGSIRRPRAPGRSRRPPRGRPRRA